MVFTSGHPIDASGISAGDLTVAGHASLSVAGVSVSEDHSTSVTAVFSISAPAGGWVLADNGLYALSLASGAAKDAAGNPSAAAIGSFQVNLPQPAGTIDSTFGSGVNVTTPFVAESVAAQPDGKLLIAGHQGDITAGKAQGVVERLNADGSIDSTFGVSGKIVTAAGSNDAFFSILLQPDGRIIVSGSTSGGAGKTDFLLERFDTSGKIDPSFGKAGRAVADFGGTTAVAYCATFTPDGGLVAGGTSDGRFAFAAFDASGALLPLFGQGGLQLYAVGSGSDAVARSQLRRAGRFSPPGRAGRMSFSWG